MGPCLIHRGYTVLWGEKNHSTTCFVLHHGRSFICFHHRFPWFNSLSTLGHVGKVWWGQFFVFKQRLSSNQVINRTVAGRANGGDVIWALRHTCGLHARRDITMETVSMSRRHHRGSQTMTVLNAKLIPSVRYNLSKNYKIRSYFCHTLDCSSNG